jgi:gluconate 5-dehydrogenase
MGEKMEQNTPFSLEGEVALITGGGTGLGLAIASAMIRAGARVVITGRREDPLRAALQDLGERAAYAVGDVTLAENRKRWLSQIRRLHGGGPSILVNNAGQNSKIDAAMTSDEEVESLLRTHVIASFALSREVQPEMTDAGHGSILFLASMASFLAIPRIVGYTAAKSSVLGIVRSLAAEWSSIGIRVNAIAPGWIESPMSRQALDNDPARKGKVLGRILAGRMGRPEEIGTAAVFLCSPAASYVYGHCLTVDGGASVAF